MILSSETAAEDATSMLEFYKQHFAVVEIVTCKNCGSLLAFECTGGDGMGLQPNELGKYVIPIGNNLLSHRVRLDEAPTGERMVGYQCGAPVLNPAYAKAKREHDKEVAAYKRQYKEDLAAAKKLHNRKRGKKKGKFVKPPYTPPILSVPETVPCGNDTRLAEIERGKVPVGSHQISLSPFEKHKIREDIRQNKKYKADFRKQGHIKHFESFQVERV